MRRHSPRSTTLDPFHWLPRLQVKEKGGAVPMPHPSPAYKLQCRKPACRSHTVPSRAEIMVAPQDVCPIGSHSNANPSALDMRLAVSDARRPTPLYVPPSVRHKGNRPGASCLESSQLLDWPPLVKDSPQPSVCASSRGVCRRSRMQKGTGHAAITAAFRCTYSSVMYISLTWSPRFQVQARFAHAANMRPRCS